MLLKVVFVSVNADYNELYARQMSQMNSNDEADSLDNFDGLSLSDPHTNGCSAILAVIINDRLFVSNVGNSTAMLCKQLNGILK
jgi:serine/threonine protein phosphatase PrpC